MSKLFSTPQRYNFNITVFSLVIALLTIHFCYGLAVINPTNINWLMSAHHDWGTHYLGWAYYKDEPWTFPLGDIREYNYPVGTNIGFTDSIPLMALLIKPFAGLLTDDFQYFGMWLLICHFFTSLYTLKILRLTNSSIYIAIFFAILMSANPVLIFRGIHPALCAQWLILASIYYYLKRSDSVTAKSINLKQGVILFISAAVNPYITAMVLGFNLILPSKHYFFEKSITFKQLVKYPLFSIGTSVLFWITLGMIEFSKATSIKSVEPFSRYSLNLNAFFNAYGDFSRFIPDLGRTNGMQYEGFAYFGVGIMLLLVILAIVFSSKYLRRRKKILTRYRSYLPLIGLCLVQFLYALTNEISFGSETLFALPLPSIIEKIGFVFRASGRFVWPLYYLIIICAFIFFSKLKLKRVYSIPILTIITVIQFYDIENLITYRELPTGTYDTPLSDRKWINTIKLFDNVIVVPSFNYNYSMTYNMDYQDYCYLALKAGKPVSNAYVARANNRKAEIFRQDLAIQLAKGEIGNELFITLPEHLNLFENLIAHDKVRMRMIDKFIFIYSKDKESNVNRYIRKTATVEKLFNSTTEKSIKTAKMPNAALQGLKETGRIKFYIDSFTNDCPMSHIRGWAILESAKDNTKDSLFIVLTQNNLSYILPVTPEIRPDISDVFKGKLDNAGFNSAINCSLVPKGKFNIGVMIKDQDGKVSFSKSEKYLDTHR